MNGRWLVLALLLPGMALAQGYAGLGREAADYAEVTAPAALAFPRDHGPHPDFRIEWWYLTANLDGADGEEYGAQWTLFRIAIAPGPERPGWASNQVWMGHAAVTTADAHRFAETYARGGIGQAGVAPAPFRAWIDDWEMAGEGDGLGAIAVRAGGADFAYALAARADRPPVKQGQDGYSVKSAAGQASYYYSQPFYAVEGTLTVDGRTVAVTGQAWLDREWSSQPMGAEQEGWDWFALHLKDGAKVMLYRFRSTGGRAELAGTWIRADGRPEPLAPADLRVTPGREAEVAGRRLPVEWRIEIPSRGFAVDTRPLNAQTWLETDFAYWEGPIRFAGTHSGRGYLEMTGYD